MAKKTKAAAPAASKKGLADYFPVIRTKEEIRKIITSRADLNDLFQSWEPSRQEEFLNFCSGNKGVKVLYDGVFKEIFNPENAPERLERILSLLLNRKVSIKAVLPNDSVRLGAESSLLYTDIIVQLEDGSLSNIEIQKLGYAFPGQRSACYSSDHLLRQYKRVRGDRGKHFHYQDIKNVYTIVFFETSTSEFHQFPDNWIHTFRQKSDTGLTLELLQEYLFIPLDIFKKNMDNKPIETELEAWLTFLSFDEPERIVELIHRYPQFKAMYEDIYEICLNMEKVMNMYSKELQELDHNTVMYMIDEMQAQLDQRKQLLLQTEQQLKRKEEQLEKTEQRLEETEQRLEETEQRLEETEQRLEETEQRLEETEQQFKQQKSQLKQQDSQLKQQDNQLKQQNLQLQELTMLVQKLQQQLPAR